MFGCVITSHRVITFDQCPLVWLRQNTVHINICFFCVFTEVNSVVPRNGGLGGGTRITISGIGMMDTLLYSMFALNNIIVSLQLDILYVLRITSAKKITMSCIFPVLSHFQILCKMLYIGII